MGEVDKKKETAFRISLKLVEGKSPHLYVIVLKQLMESDTSLHPMMERTLKMLKRTRTPYIMLAPLREVVIDPLNLRHFDRAAQQGNSWVVTLWSEDEIKEHIKNPEEHLKAILRLFQKLGYDLYDSQVVSSDYIKTLEELTEGQITAQIEGRKNK
jgi:hypothetical protein